MLFRWIARLAKRRQEYEAACLATYHRIVDCAARRIDVDLDHAVSVLIAAGKSPFDYAGDVRKRIQELVSEKPDDASPPGGPTIEE